MLTQFQQRKIGKMFDLYDANHDGLIEEASGDASEDPGERRQYFSLTSLGTKVARAEVKRLEALVVDPRARKLLRAR